MAKISKMVATDSDLFDRQAEVVRFKHLLNGDGKPILFLYGIPGIGKTTLLRKFANLCQENNHLFAQIDWATIGNNRVMLLASLRDQLTQSSRQKSIVEFRAFDEDLLRYLSIYREAMGMKQEVAVGVADSLTLLLKEVMKPLPLSGPILDSLRAHLEQVIQKMPSSRRDLLLNPVNYLTHVFCRSLCAVARKHAFARRVVLLFDRMEYLVQPEDLRWLQDELICNLEDVAIVLTSRDTTPEQNWMQTGLHWERAIDFWPVREFPLSDAEDYLNKNGVGYSDREVILKITGQHPLAMAIAIDWIHQNPAVVGIDWDTYKQRFEGGMKSHLATEFFLTRLVGEDVDSFIREAAVLQRFTGDSLIAIFGKDYLPELKNHPFVKCDPATGFYHFHDLVSDLLRTSFFRDYPLRYRELNQKALKYYKELEQDASGIDVEIVLTEQLYHQLILDEAEGIRLLRQVFYRAAEFYQIGLCETLLQEARHHPLKPGRQLWLDFLQGEVYRLQNNLTYASELLEKVLKEKDIEPELMLNGQVALGEIYYKQGKNKIALENLVRCLSLPVIDSDSYRKNIGLAHWHLGRIYRSEGQMDLAIAHLEQSTVLLEQSGQRYLSGYALCTLGEVHQMMGDYQRAIHPLQQCQLILSVVGEKDIYGRALHIEGRVHHLQGQWERARTLLTESLKLRESIQDQHGVAFSHWGLGWFFLSMGDYDSALLHEKQSLSIFESIGIQDGVARCKRTLGEIHIQLKQWREASQMLAESLAIQEARGGAYEQGLILRDRGELARLLSNWDESEMLNLDAYRLALNSQNRRGEAEILVNLAKLECNRGRITQLGEYLGKVEPLLLEFGYPDLKALVRVLTGIHALLLGNYDNALADQLQGSDDAVSFHPVLLDQAVALIWAGLRSIENNGQLEQAKVFSQRLVTAWRERGWTERMPEIIIFLKEKSL
jgi:tetratricopeptide (TPR) repeat protein